MPRIDSIQLPNGAANGRVLTSDANGNATWQAGGGGGTAEVNVSAAGPSPRVGELLWVDTDETLPAVTPQPMDTWHVVGAAGEPAFNADWQSYTVVDPSWGSVAFRKFPDGRVMLRGFPRTVGGQAAGSSIFTLPVGYRPPKNLLFADQAVTGTAQVRIDIGSVGTIAVGSSLGATSWVTLDGLTFDTETVTSFVPALLPPQPMDTWHAVGAAGEPAFEGGSANFDAANRPAKFRKYADGKVRLAGTVTGGNAGYHAVFTLPVGYRPAGGPRAFTCPIGAAPGNNQMTVYSTGVVEISGGYSYAFLDGIEFDTETVTSYATSWASSSSAPGWPRICWTRSANCSEPCAAALDMR